MKKLLLGAILLFSVLITSCSTSNVNRIQETPTSNVNRIQETPTSNVNRIQEIPTSTTTHTGPRGGVYHYTSSGKKSYNKKK